MNEESIYRRMLEGLEEVRREVDQWPPWLKTDEAKEIMRQIDNKEETACSHCKEYHRVYKLKRKSTQLLQALEDRMDLSDARASLAEANKKGTKAFSVLKKELERGK